MSQEVKVGKSLAFSADANNLDNIDGRPSNKKCVVYDDFTGIALDSGRWVYAGNNGGTEAITAGTNGTVTLTTGATSEDRSLLATPLIFLAAQNPIIECRIALSSFATVAVNFCFTDATTEGNDALPMEILAAAAVNGKATDAVGFVFDTDATYDYWHVQAVDTDVEGTPVLCKAPAKVYHGTTRLALGAPVDISAGTQTVTVGIGTFLIDLPSGAYGTATSGTATVTGSPVSLTPGLNTITTTVAGTVTIAYGLTPYTTFHTLRIAMDSSANCTFYHDGKAVGRLPACTTAATPFCAMLGVMARTTSARVLTVDYFKAWQDRN